MEVKETARERVMARETANKRDGQSTIQTVGEIWSATETRSDRDGKRENERDRQRENERDGQKENERDGQKENERDGQRENERDGQREIVRREMAT